MLTFLLAQILWNQRFYVEATSNMPWHCATLGNEKPHVFFLKDVNVNLLRFFDLYEVLRFVLIKSTKK